MRIKKRETYMWHIVNNISANILIACAFCTTFISFHFLVLVRIFYTFFMAKQIDIAYPCEIKYEIANGTERYERHKYTHTRDGGNTEHWIIHIIHCCNRKSNILYLLFHFMCARIFFRLIFFSFVRLFILTDGIPFNTVQPTHYHIKWQLLGSHMNSSCPSVARKKMYIYYIYMSNGFDAIEIFTRLQSKLLIKNRRWKNNELNIEKNMRFSCEILQNIITLNPSIWCWLVWIPLLSPFFFHLFSLVFHFYFEFFFNNFSCFAVVLFPLFYQFHFVWSSIFMFCNMDENMVVVRLK